jgi:hypothetical protein
MKNGERKHFDRRGRKLREAHEMKFKLCMIMCVHRKSASKFSFGQQVANRSEPIGDGEYVAKFYEGEKEPTK